MKSEFPKASAVVRVAFGTSHQTKAVATALAPELQHPAGDKAKAKILVRGKEIHLQFYAKDSTALRAIMSSYLRMVAAALNVSNSLLQLEYAPIRTTRARTSRDNESRESTFHDN